MKKETFEAGQWLLTEGNFAYFLYKLTKGTVSIYYKDKKIGTHEVKKGNPPMILGILAALKKDRQHLASVKTETEVEVEVLNFDHIQGLLKNDVPKGLRDEIDTMIQAITLEDQIKRCQQELSELNRVDLKIPDKIDAEVKCILTAIKELYSGANAS
ncbi:MAG: cyclic nucleotide-binding domain-containing protein [Nitrospinae bacterium]|nr:cyclic nucleotide-binding domain-containing protein [Nitrospinota bacterium]